MPKRTHRAGAPPASAKAPSQRMLRVGELVRHKLSDMLVRGEIHDDVLASHVVTISEVRMSPDLRLATAYVMPLGGHDVGPVVRALEGHARYIRGAVAKAVNLQFAPNVRFRADKSFDEATRIDRLLDSPEVRRDVERRDQDDTAADPDRRSD